MPTEALHTITDQILCIIRENADREVTIEALKTLAVLGDLLQGDD